MLAATSPSSHLQRLARVYHTVQPLRWTQIWHQIRRRLHEPELTVAPTASQPVVTPLKLEQPISKQMTLTEGGQFRFLNREAYLGAATDWNADGMPMLWRYNLHYFDYLQQPDIDREGALSLMVDWAQRHPPSGSAVGWQPYPMSLRVVNWLKFFSACGEFPRSLVSSLYLQAENLAKRIEYHLLGNHLLANGKALWFSGAFLKNGDWLQTGRQIVLAQLTEQFLADGGHFELSPMYHALAVEDLLDLINLCRGSGDDDARVRLKATAVRALSWLDCLVSHNGDLPLLNDAVNGIAPTLRELTSYAARLDVGNGKQAPMVRFDSGWNGIDLSGYWILQNGSLRLIFDTAELGPDYLPGHAHCDMLSLLMYFRGRAILADTGVFEYSEGSRRSYSRSTAAHNTVVLDDLEQGDIWKSFRMGKRGRPVRRSVSSAAISCEHTGFRIFGNRLRHRRSVRFLRNGFEVHDYVTGPATHSFRAAFHLAPGVTASEVGTGRFEVANELLFETWGGAAELTSSEYYPEFGIVQERACLLFTGTFHGEHRLGLRCTYCS